MNRSIAFSAVLLVASLFVGNALKAQAAGHSLDWGAPTTSARWFESAAQASADDGVANTGYWAAWAEAASH